jgi:hypothetical protein
MPHDNTERIGINAVEAIFLGFKWTFRPQVISDYDDLAVRDSR